MRWYGVALLLISACFRGPELYPDHLTLSGSAPGIRRAIFSDFYQLTAGKKAKVSTKNLPDNSKAKDVIDISAEMAERLSLEGLTSEARDNFSAMDLKTDEVLIRGVIANRPQRGFGGLVLAVASSVTIGVFLYLYFRAVPVTNIYQIECKYEYFIEAINSRGKTVFELKGEIIAEHTTRWVTSKSGKCQMPNKQTLERIKINMTQDLADYFISNAPSTAPTSTSLPAQ
jgi:hypothetical protein